MRGLMIVCVMALVLVAANTVMAADVSDQTLAAMGISGMEKVSDAQGMEVRGKGYFMGVGGFGTANFFGTTRSDGHIVGVWSAGIWDPAPTHAAGVSGSVAGTVVGGSFGGGGFIAGGASFAFGGGYVSVW